MVKFQKRTIGIVYTEAELDKPRESPFGNTTREQKQGLEFESRNMTPFNDYCRLVCDLRYAPGLRRPGTWKA